LAVAIALKEKTRGFHVNGNAAYVRRMNAELEAGKVICLRLLLPD